MKHVSIVILFNVLITLFWVVGLVNLSNDLSDAAAAMHASTQKIEELNRQIDDLKKENISYQFELNTCYLKSDKNTK
jgi:1,4-dihydroxy-2-naphthoate octaprenyltransferase